jgi:hypothetical protein
MIPVQRNSMNFKQDHKDFSLWQLNFILYHTVPVDVNKLTVPSHRAQ